MEVINVNEKLLANLKQLKVPGHNNGGTIYIYNETTLYKIFNDRYTFIDEKIRNVKFLVDQNIRYALTPKKVIIMDGEVYGYSMDYLTNSNTFKNEVELGLMDYKKKLRNIKNVYTALRDTHKLGVYLGDIHLDNLLYDDNHGYLIDFDDVRFPDEDDYKFFTYYNLIPDERNLAIAKENRYTDNIKMALACLSYLYGYGLNFEEVATCYNIDYIIQLFKSLDIITYKLIKEVLTNFSGELIYFDQILPHFSKCDLEDQREQLLYRMY